MTMYDCKARLYDKSGETFCKLYDKAMLQDTCYPFPLILLLVTNRSIKKVQFLINNLRMIKCLTTV